MKDTETTTLPRFSAFLKEYTKNEHQALEKQLVHRMKITRTPQAYIQLLGLFYYYYDAVETAMAPYLNIPDAPRRRKAAAILQDIRTMGGTLPETPLPVPVPVIAGYAQAMGVAYVLEGSTLGGTIIAKMIGEQLGITDGAGFSFFNAYGAETGEMWKKFRSYLDEMRPEDQQPAADAARSAFLNFKAWATSYESIFEI